MVLNKSKLIPFSDTTSQVNFIQHSLPGIYFLFNKDYELIYIGESKTPLGRVVDHYFKAYANNKIAKGVGPIFNYFRIITVKDADFRIRQHFEKRWIKKYKPPVNANADSAPYELSYKQIKDFILVYEGFFKKNISWFRYINDEVLKKLPSYKKYRNIKRRERAIKRGSWEGL